ncbi:MAG: hypothetical protein EOP23_22020 [Hyphomicrobiales bacterium]|nr:MAG: hypothetical protein EOP23_22020 [Hyphomicrobiales bacterium]
MTTGAKGSAVMLALVASIHVLRTRSISEDVDGRDKPDHDGKRQSITPWPAPAPGRRSGRHGARARSKGG